jgi:hypothetical protein
VSTGRGKFPEETSSEPCKWVMWIRDVQASGCNERRGCKALPVGAFVEGEAAPVLDAIFSKPIHAFYSFLFFILLFFIAFSSRG